STNRVGLSDFRTRDPGSEGGNVATCTRPRLRLLPVFRWSVRRAFDLWSAARYRRFGFFCEPKPKNQSGDTSPHSKERSAGPAISLKAPKEEGKGAVCVFLPSCFPHCMSASWGKSWRAVGVVQPVGPDRSPKRH